MKFAVVGTGGVGGYFGGKLAKSNEGVWFLARGKHLEAMRANGLRINSFEGNWVIPSGRMTDNPLDIGAVDVVLFCVKSYDTESAAAQLEPMLSENTIVISFQNGVDNEEKIRGIIPRGHGVRRRFLHLLDHHYTGPHHTHYRTDEDCVW